ncbi:acetyl-CoA hydrolase [Pseudohyphozyma bogoriensis]|nr:acetyl-CoA hydrolase [Pseudohyphozyma bogoriensis]
MLFSKALPSRVQPCAARFFARAPGLRAKGRLTTHPEDAVPTNGNSDDCGHLGVTGGDSPSLLGIHGKAASDTRPARNVADVIMTDSNECHPT